MRFVTYMAGRNGRVIRVVMGLALITVGALLGGGWWALAAFGLLPLLTGAFDICPIGPLMRLPLMGKAFPGAACPAEPGKADAACRTR